MSVPCHLDMASPQVMNGGDILQLWKVVVTSFGGRGGANNPST
jgi:hypothetical protein